MDRLIWGPSTFLSLDRPHWIHNVNLARLIATVIINFRKKLNPQNPVTNFSYLQVNTDEGNDCLLAFVYILAFYLVKYLL